MIRPALRALAAAARVLALAAALAPAAGAQDQAAPVPDVPSGGGAVVGRVLRAEDGAPVAGCDVVLYALPADAPPGLRHATAGPDGRFAFERVDASPRTTYLVGARYEGVSYPGARVQFTEGETRREVEVRVHETTTDAAGVAARELRVRLDWLGDRLVAAESLTAANPGSRTVYVPAGARAGRAPALALGLPAGARHVSGPFGVLPDGVEVAGESVRWFGPLYPGDSELTLSYELPVQAGAVSLARPLPGPLHVTVLVPAGGPQIEAPGLTAGEDTVEDGRGYKTFAGDVREPRLALSLRVPPARTDPSAVSVAEVRVIGELDAAAFVAREEHVIHVEGETPVVAAGGAPLLTIPLPRDASDLRFGAPESGTQLVAREDGSLGVLGPLPPGETVLEVRYRIPAHGAAFTLARRFGARVPLLSVYVADTGRLDVESERLHRRRPVQTPDRSYLHFEAFEVTPDEHPALRIASRPAQRGLPRAATVLLVAAGAGLVALALAAPFRRERAAAARDAAFAEDPARHEREVLVDALRDLEHDFETDKLDAADYERMRGELRGRALELLAAERRVEPAPAGAGAGAAAAGPESAGPAEAGRGCAACGRVPAPGDRFCAGCGARLLAA